MSNKIKVKINENVSVNVYKAITIKEYYNFFEITDIIINGVVYTKEELKKHILNKYFQLIEQKRQEYIKDNINKKIVPMYYVENDTKYTKLEHNKSRAYCSDLSLENLHNNEIKLVIDKHYRNLFYNIVSEEITYNNNKNILHLDYSIIDLDMQILNIQLKLNTASEYNQIIAKYNTFIKDKKSIKIIINNKEYALKSKSMRFYNLFMDWDTNKICLKQALNESCYKIGDDIIVKHGHKTITLNFKNLPHIDGYDK